MKNIHILPTDKPSRLYLGNNGNFVFGMIQTSIQSRNDDFANQHIYITSDKEITVGYWLDLADNSIIKVTLKDLIKFKSYDKLQFKKIILTTDPDLIKDGVQLISNEFLQWFVKNPSCEVVEIEEKSRCCGRCNGIDDLCYADMSCDNHKEVGCEICYGKRIKYKIIIPKEEPKQIKCYCGHTIMCDCSPLDEPKQETHICKWCKAETWQSDDECYAKQETLEEAAERIYDDNLFNYEKYRSGFVEGAKWQQERTEKEMQSAWEDGRNNVITVGKPPFVITKFQHNSFSNWFEKFKKK